jgi:long-chain acyl-CoA synthetase
MLTHNNLVMNMLQGLYNGGEAIEPLIYGKLTSLQILPLCHAMGFAGFIGSLCLAVQMIMLRFEPSNVLEAIETYKIRFFGAVPAMYQMLVNSPDFTKRDISSLLGASSGSAALPPEINKKWEQVTGLKVSQGYGLTETSPFTHGNTAWMPKVKRRSIGAPAIDTDSIIVNTETLEEAKLGEVGEIWIRGPQIMKGYWRRPEATSNVLVKREDGNIWFRTGDLGRIDEDGFFYIEGRSKDIIKYKGYKILPVEVEQKLYEHPAVLEAGVVAAPDSNIGETIKAFVVLKDEFKDKITEQEIIEWSKEHLAGYKYPRKVEFIDELPRTPVRKVDRKKLRKAELKAHTH